MAFPLATVRGTVYWTGKRATPLLLFFLVRGYGKGLRRASPRWDSCCSRAEMERSNELRGALHGQARGVSQGVGYWQDLGSMERRTPPRPVGDGAGQPQGRFQ